MFLVVGQSNARGRGQEPPVVTIPPNTAYEYNAATFTVNDLSNPSGSACLYKSGVTGGYWTALQYGFVVAFAKKWAEQTNRISVFVCRAKGGSGLVPAGDIVGSGYWTNYSSTDPDLGIYRNAVTDMTNAQGFVGGLLWGIRKKYLIWLQGESDAHAGVSTTTYQDALADLFTHFDSDLPSPKFSGYFVSEIGYYPGYNWGISPAPDSKQDWKQVQPIVTALQQIQTQVANAVLVSKLPRYLTSPCINGLGAVGCQSWDLAHYTTAAYEQFGTDMAVHAYVFDSTGYKPLLASSCAASPTTCSGMVDVYRRNNGVDHMHTLDPMEFDGTAYAFKGVRFHLTQNPSMGLVALYRKYNASTGDRMESVSASDSGYVVEGPNGGRLGYCATSGTSLMPNALRRLALGNNRVSTKDPVEISAFLSAGYVYDPNDATQGLLCYVH
jgi:hypothetical protein